MMMSRLLFLLHRHRSLSSVANVAGEIAAHLAAKDVGASVKQAEQFLLFEAAGASDVPDLYRAVAAAAPRSEPAYYLSAAASALVEASARAALPDGALRLLELLIDTPGAPLPSGSSCDLLMEKLLSLRRHADVRRVFGTLVAAGERLGTAEWNKAVQACILAGDLQEALWRLRRMGRDGAPRPDAQTFTAVVAALWRDRRGADAAKVFGEMADMGVAPNRSTSNAMLRGYLKAGDLESASELRTQMMQDGVDLNLYKQPLPMLRKLYAAMMKDYLKTKDLGAASMLNDVMEKEGMELLPPFQEFVEVVDIWSLLRLSINSDKIIVIRKRVM